MAATDSQPPHARRAFTVLEVAVSCAVLSLLIGMTAAALGRVGLMRARVARQQYAQHVVEDLVERVSAIPYHRVSQEAVDAIMLDEDVEAVLLEPQLTFDFEEVANADPAARRVVVRLRWHVGRGRAPDHITTSVLRLPASPQVPAADEPEGEPDRGGP